MMIVTLLFILFNLILFCFASISSNDAVIVPEKNEDLPNALKERFMFGKNGEKIITSSGKFTVRYPTYSNVFFFRVQTNSKSAGSVTICFETSEKLKSQHYECEIGQCGMKLYFFNDKIYLNHDQYSLPFLSNETIIFGYSNQNFLKLRIGKNGYKEFPARCSLPNDFTTVTNENQITFNVDYQLINAKLELATSYLIIKGESPASEEISASASVTLGIVCAFLIPIFIVIGLGEGYILWKKRETFKSIFLKKSKTVAAVKNQAPPPLKT